VGLSSKTWTARGAREKASKTAAMWSVGPRNCLTSLIHHPDVVDEPGADRLALRRGGVLVPVWSVKGKGTRTTSPKL